MIIQVVLLVLIVLIIWGVVDRYRRSQIKRTELLTWLPFWLIVGVLVAWPDGSQRAAELVGIGRGVDLIVYLALVLVFYLLFRVFVRFEKVERDITKLVRKIALDEAEKKEKEGGNVEK